jgi:hypothetical protein
MLFEMIHAGSRLADCKVSVHQQSLQETPDEVLVR